MSDKKVDELVEWAEELLYNENRTPNQPPWFLVHKNDSVAEHWNRVARRILSHPDLALIDRRLEIVLADINSNEDIEAEDINEPYMVIPLSEALKDMD